MKHRFQGICIALLLIAALSGAASLLYWVTAETNVATIDSLQGDEQQAVRTTPGFEGPRFEKVRDGTNQTPVQTETKAFSMADEDGIADALAAADPMNFERVAESAVDGPAAEETVSLPDQVGDLAGWEAVKTNELDDGLEPSPIVFLFPVPEHVDTYVAAAPAVLSVTPEAMASMESRSRESVQAIYDEFVETFGNIEVDPADSKYLRKWNDAVAEADRKFRLHFGHTAWVRMNLEAGHLVNEY